MTECRDGFESNGGNPCIPCSLNTYGKFCVEKCDCGIYQRCHHVDGCIRRSKTDSITDLGSVRTWTSATTTELSSTDIQHDISRDFPIYLALGIGGISINMVLCIMCVVSYKRKRHSNDIISNENAAMGPIEDANIQEHAYDDIDENAIMADITNHGVVINQHIKEYLKVYEVLLRFFLANREWMCGCDHIIGCVDFTTTVDLYQGYSMVQRSVTEEESSNDKPKKDTEFKPILIYIVAAGSFTIIFTITVFVISRRRKRYTNNNRIQRENESADLQRENEQIEQYSTIL
ncbi:MEGF10_11 [Mytilus edulis]|uniref:MEGF10_11 n=1 Tax=Mytilus edulis TaxID=6550 RepID=A0A8S3QRS8_MYTED|nr:MEGF10_11 [Mytilus edulis]